MDKIKNFLVKNDIDFVLNFDTAELSTMKIGSILNIAIFPKNENEFIKILLFFHRSKVLFRVVGNLSNVLFVESVSFPVVITNKMTDAVKIEGNIVHVSAGVTINRFFDVLKKNNLSGLETLVGIPATIGGAIRNNAGAFGGSISDHLLKIKVFFKGEILELEKKQIKFFYHFSNLQGFVIISATFLFEKKNEYDIINLANRYSYLRNVSQPNGFSLGSVFKKINDKSAGFYIERAGLKGVHFGDVFVSRKHANFFINEQNGSVADFLTLLGYVETSVERQYGLKLVPEIEKIGEIDETFSRFTHSFR